MEYTNGLDVYLPPGREQAVRILSRHVIGIPLILSILNNLLCFGRLHI